ncbi:glycosyltransferase family 9 protein [Granulicella sp. L46]|uniref:glycosyltransferase family 9 protein n=1 Tax=Granulicella sp. L46 TaxID=1641865 RepID=UPI00131ACDA9|nr:glycosyltransferase family 9 protein [Granulicella sp. L46]
MQKGTLRPDSVLLIRLDAIGDFVLWLDAAQATVKHYKAQGKSVVLVANAAWAEWAKELAIFDDVIALDRRKYEQEPLYRFRLGRRIRKLKCSIAVQPTYSREFFWGDAVVRISGASERIGSAGDNSNISPWQKRISDRWYTRLISATPAPCMELVRNAEFIRGLGEISFLAKAPNLRAMSTLRKGESFLAAMQQDQRYYVLFPGASWDGRQWPVASFVQIAARLYHETGWHGVICGGNVDRQLAEDICGLSRAPLMNWAGRTDLPQLAAILSEAQLLLTNETSAVHIAAAAGVPTVCILGGGHYGRFMPYLVEQTDGRSLPYAITHQMPCFGCNWHCIYTRSNGVPVPCIDRITEEEVWNAISTILRPVTGTFSCRTSH